MSEFSISKRNSLNDDFKNITQSKPFRKRSFSHPSSSKQAMQLELNEYWRKALQKDEIRKSTDEELLDLLTGLENTQYPLPGIESEVCI